MKKKNEKEIGIGISCIGSGVGQSVINSLNLSELPLTTIGLGTNPFAYGAYDCDYYDYLPNIYTDNYVDQLIKKCKELEIDLVVPGLDDEALFFAKNIDKFEKFGIKTICSSEEFITLCRDKERMSNQLNPIADVFVKCFKNNSLKEEIKNGKIKFPLIAKPRGGFASRGVEILLDESDLGVLKEDHIIQELAIPKQGDPNRENYLKQIEKRINPQLSEISIQLVFNEKGDLLGKMASYNKLNNGIPIDVLPYENEEIWESLDKLIPEFLKLGLKGPVNIQGRMTDEGLKLFEMNPRFTGITGLRALMGFNEVEACVKEWMGIDKGKNQLHFNYHRFGMRQVADKSLPIVRNQRITQLSHKLGQEPAPKKKIILITGATGYLGQNLIRRLKDEDLFEIWVLGRDSKRINNILSDFPDQSFTHEDLQNGLLQLGLIDILLHCGFARPHNSNRDIADSLKFTSDLFSRASRHQVPAIINISSQSVYGTEIPPLWEESDPVSPSTNYGQAKHATELALNSMAALNKNLHHTSIRLGTIAGGAPGLVGNDFLSKLVNQSLNGNNLKIYGGNQMMERLDLRDAVSGLLELLKSDSQAWKPVYNLGSDKQYSLIQIAQEINYLVSKSERREIGNIDILESKKDSVDFGLKSDLFYRDFNWMPKHDISSTIDSLINYFKTV